MAPPGTLDSIAAASIKYFRKMFLVHLACACAMLGLGIAAAVKTDGSDGTAIVPYFFTAFIAGCWHLALLTVAVMCCSFLSKRTSIVRRAKHWVNGYTVLSSIFILFNMMGVVFCVVYGLCLEGQLCYYDHNMATNRGLAVTIICGHSVFLVLCVFATKRAYLIESELHTDISVRLGQDYMLVLNESVWRGTHRPRSAASTIGSAASLDDSSSDTDDSMQRNVFLPSNKPFHQSASRINTIPQASIFHISKSNPNLKRRSESMEAAELEGTLVSIFSDCDTKEKSTAQKNRSKVFPNRTRSNKVTPEKTIDNSNPLALGIAHKTLQTGERKSHENTRDNNSLSSLEGRTNDSSNRERKHKKKPRKKRKNSVQSHSDSETNDSELVIADVTSVPSNPRDEQTTRDMGHLQLQLQQQQHELQRRQLEMQEKQERLLRQQEHLDTHAPAGVPPPPYNQSAGPATRPTELKLAVTDPPPAYEEMAGPQSIVELDTKESENSEV